MHQFIFLPIYCGNAVQMRPFGCCCEACHAGEWESCANPDFVVAPKLMDITRRDSQSQVVTRLEYMRTGEDLADDIDVSSEEGSHVCFVTEESGYQYYIMRVTKGPHQLQADVKDAAGNTMFEKGEWVIAGNYYERYPPAVVPHKWHACSERLYHLDSIESFQYTHLVTVTHFTLPMNTKKNGKVKSLKGNKALKDVFEVPGHLHDFLVAAASGHGATL